MKLPCFIINLEDAGHNFEKQKVHLLKEGIEPVRFIGVDARRDDHIRYADYVTPVCFKTCPKTAIGCGLSHILLARRLRKLGIPMALILEDDAFPKVCNLLEHIQKTIQETPDSWDMIKLHCAGCIDNITRNTGTGAAAYLLSATGIQKVADMKLSYHIDHQFNRSDLITYKSPYNLFWTDESYSAVRASNPMWLNIKETTGERLLSQSMTYTTFRIPGTSIEIAWWQHILIGLIIAILIAYLGTFV